MSKYFDGVNILLGIPVRNSLAANRFFGIRCRHNSPHLNTARANARFAGVYKRVKLINRSTDGKMLDSLTLVIEKLFVLSNFNLFKNLWLEEEEETCSTSTTLKRGDLLEVQRTLFTHFGIYLGDNKVAHLMPDIMPLLTVNEKKINAVVTNKRLVLGCIYKKASIRVDTVGDFAYGARIFVNSVDGRMKTKALAQEDVAQRAEKMVGDIPYSLLWNNCEHFATYCRYDSPVSEQTDQVDT